VSPFSGILLSFGFFLNWRGGAVDAVRSSAIPAPRPSVAASRGVGYIKGSPMTGVTCWATVGPVVAGLGVALALVGWCRPKG